MEEEDTVSCCIFFFFFKIAATNRSDDVTERKKCVYLESFKNLSETKWVMSHVGLAIDKLTFSLVELINTEAKFLKQSSN